jgi:N6-adenosine-specific RNA methylase IME4
LDDLAFRYRHGVIYADPPWHHAVPLEPYTRHPSTVYSQDGEADKDDATMPWQAIAAVPVETWAARPCVLAMWATAPHLGEAMSVLSAWGFDYKTCIGWVKEFRNGEPARGVGVWVMQPWEFLLIGVRGAPGVRSEERKPYRGVLGLLVDAETTGDDKARRVFYGERSRHSRKPLEVQEYLESFQIGDYLELFATRPRDGWTTWGFDTGFRLSERGVERFEVRPDPQLALDFPTEDADGAEDLPKVRDGEGSA